MSKPTVAFDSYDPTPEISARDRALLGEAFAAHQITVACVRAMRENADLRIVHRAMCAEHFIHAVKIQRKTLGYALRTAESASNQADTLYGALGELSDRGIHYRGMSDEGRALVVVRR